VTDVENLTHRLGRLNNVTQDSTQQPVVETSQAIGGEVIDQLPASDNQHEAVIEPAKVMRIGSMVRQLLEEVRTTQLDAPSRERLAEIYERSIVEISSALSPDLAHELHMLTLPFKEGEIPSDGELRVAKAQLVGWLEGLFHGIQATLFAQQMAARQQIEQMRQIPSQMPEDGPVGGTYL